jgi:hypothetical protein
MTIDVLDDDFTKLENLLQQWVDPIRATPMLAGFEVLRAYDQHSAWSDVSKVLESDTDKPIADNIEYIEHCLGVEVDSTLCQLGIGCGGTLMFRISVLEGLKLLEDINEPEAVVAITEESTDPVMALCELLQLATTTPWSEYISHIVTVPQRQIERLHSLYAPLVEDAESGLISVFESNDKEKAIRLSRFIDIHNKTLVIESLGNMRPLGTPMYILLNDHKMALGDLEPNAPDQAALEIMGLGLLADIPFGKFTTRIKEVVEEVYTSIDFITRANVELDRLIAEVIHGQA